MITYLSEFFSLVRKERKGQKDESFDSRLGDADRVRFANRSIPPVSATPTHMLRICVISPLSRRRQHTCFAYVLIPPVSATPTHMLRICVNSPLSRRRRPTHCVHWSIPPVSATPTNALRALVNSPNTPSGYRPLSPFRREPLLHLSLY